MKNERQTSDDNKIEKSEIPDKERKEFILVFQLNAILETFDEVDTTPSTSLKELLYHDLVLSFVDPEHKAVWIWKGRGATTRMKFLAAQLAPTIRDRYGIDYTIISIDDGEEPSEFKECCGLK
ncbi:MAG: hypothetical protein ACFFDO_04265 [Candidatus Thorarchaeota archaeon]